jgi:hypothetical protein
MNIICGGMVVIQDAEHLERLLLCAREVVEMPIHRQIYLFLSTFEGSVFYVFLVQPGRQ